MTVYGLELREAGHKTPPYVGAATVRPAAGQGALPYVEGTSSQQQVGLLQKLLHPLEELGRGGAVHDPVVEGE